MGESRRRRFGAGFTLVELMIVVAILAVLAAVAIVAYRPLMRRVHRSEAVGMLGMIRMRQESYRSEFSQYCDVSSSTHDGTSGSVSSLWPTSAPGQTADSWSNSLPTEWTQLGVQSSGPVYFRYATVAGSPGVAPNVFGGDLGYAAAPNHGPWWAADAIGDLDGDGTRSTFEMSSFNETVWRNNEDE